MAERAIPLTAETWITSDQACAVTGWTDRWLRMQAGSGNVSSRPSSKAGANGKPQREYLLSSLPPAAQLKYAMEGGCSRPGQEDALALRQAAPLFKDNPEALAGRALLPDNLDPQARARYDAIAPLIECARRNGGEGVTALAKFIAAQSATMPAGKFSERTLWRWYFLFCGSKRKRIPPGGFAALSDAPRSDKNTSRFFAEHDAERILAEGKYLVERLSARLVWEWLAGHMAAKKRPAPSYATVRSYLNKLSQPLSIYAREGQKAFHDRCEPYVIRGPVPVMQSWVGDHGKHDVWVLNDLWDDHRGEAIRPWLTPLLDQGSRKIVGYCWCAVPSSHSISSALRMGVARFGVPRELYIDNGKDFQKIGRIGLSPEASGVCERLQITPRYCLPFSPQSKPVESFFSTVRKRFDCLWRPYYCGASPTARPEDCSEVLKKHELYRQGKLPESPLPLASEFVRLAAAWIEEYNSAHVHSGRGMKGRTPDQVFDEAWPAFKRQPTNPRDLDPLLWDRVRRRLSEGGCVQLSNARYQPADPASLGALCVRIGEDVLIARDPYNLGEAAAFDSDGLRFLGALRAQALLEQGPSSHEQVRESMRQRRQFRRGVAAYVHYLESARRAAGVPTELEALALRAGIATGSAALPLDLAPGARAPRALLAPPAPPQSPEDFIESFSDAKEGD